MSNNLLKKLIIASSVFLIHNISYGQVVWPFMDNTMTPIRGEVKGTPGEFRTSGGHRFHGGVDLTNGTNTSVYAINSGLVTKVYYASDCWNSYIQVDNVQYKHIKNDNLQNGDLIIEGDYLGEMFLNGGCFLHVHINEAPTGNNTVNFLNQQLFPFSDLITAPVFISPFNANGTILTNSNSNAVEFWKEGHTFNDNASANLLSQSTTLSSTTYRLIYNKVDIVARVKDYHISTTGNGTGAGNNGPNSISFEILNKNNVSYDGAPVQNINFNSIPPNNLAGQQGNYLADITFDSRSVCCPSGTTPRHVYVITSNPNNTPHDRYFNTKLRNGITENWLNNPLNDAIVNEDAHYKDNIYNIRVVAKDIANFQNTTQNSSIQHTAPIIIDNFLPYVKNITIKNTGSNPIQTKYFAEWKWNDVSSPNTLKLLPGLVSRLQGVIDPRPPLSEGAEIRVAFSEPIRVNPPVPQKFYLNVSPKSNPNLIVPASYASTNTDNTEIVWTLSPLQLTQPGMSDELVDIRIGVLDLAGNPLMGLSQNKETYTDTEIPNRQANGTWSCCANGDEDLTHFFKIIPSCINGNRIAQRNSSMTGSCMDADFDAPTASIVNGHIEGIVGDATATITFEDLTAPNAASWFWDFGDGTTNTMQNPTHTYTTAGIFNVKLAAYSGSESDVEEKAGYVKITNPGGTYTNIDFTPSATNIPVNGTISFINNCVGYSASAIYEWSFDGVVSDYTGITPPDVIYPTASSSTGYDVTLAVTDNSITTSVTKKILVGQVQPQLSVFVPAPTVPSQSNPYTLQFQSIVSGGTPPYTFHGWEYSDQPGVVTLNNTHSFPGTTTSYSAKACYTDAVTGNPVCDTHTGTIVAATANITALDRNKSQDFGNCQAFWDFELHYTITPPLQSHQIFWRYENVGNSANNFTYGPTITPFDHQYLGSGDWIVTAEVQINGGVIASITETINNCIAADGAITFFGLNPGGNGCFSGSVLSGSPYDLLTFDVNTANNQNIIQASDNPTCPNGDPFHASSCLNNPGCPCYNMSLNPQNPISDYPFHVLINNAHIFFQVLYQANNWNQNNPVSNSFVLRVFKTSHTNGFYDFEDKMFSGTWYKCLTSNSLDIGNDLALCPGGTAQLGGTPTVDAGEPAYIYSWTSSQGSSFSSNSSSNPVYIARPLLSGETSYTDLVTLNVTDHKNDFAFKTINIYVSGVSASSISENLCSTTQNKFLNIPPTGGSGNYSYQWSPTQTASATLSCSNCTAPQITPLAATTSPQFFTVTVTDATGCTTSATASVNIRSSAAAADAGPDVTGNCPGIATSLQGNFSNAVDPSNVTWEWHPFGKPTQILASGTGLPITSFNLSPSPPEAAAFVFRVNDGGCYAEDAMYIIPDHTKGPQVNAGEDQYFCTAINSASLNFSYQLVNSTSFMSGVWSGFSNSSPCSTSPCTVNIHVGENVGTYTVTASDGCIGTDQVRITLNPINFNGAKTYFPCKGSTTSLLQNNASIIYQELAPPYAYEWSGNLTNLLSSTGVENPNFTADQSATFNVTVTDANGCSNSASNIVSMYPVTQTDPEIDIDLRNSCIKSEYADACFHFKNGIEIDLMGSNSVNTSTSFTDQFSSSPTSGCNDCNVQFFGSYRCYSYNYSGSADVTYTVTSACGVKSVNKNFNINPSFPIIQDLLIFDGDKIGDVFDPPSTTTYVTHAMNIEVGNASGYAIPYAAIDYYNFQGSVWHLDATLFAANEINIHHFSVDEQAEFFASIIPCAYFDPAAKPPVIDTLIKEESVTQPELKQSYVQNDHPVFQEKFHIAPNPTTGNVMVNIGFLTQKQAVLIIEDQLGHLIDKINLGKFSSTTYNFNIARYGLYEGMYNVKLLADDRMQIKKLVLIR